jgi:diguanylate cyclase (GGDEF)-like protein
MSISNHHDDDALQFVDEDFSITEKQGMGKDWPVLIVDDDPDVHSATTFALRDITILGRGIEFLHAYSGAEARQLLQLRKDIALIFLDVVMEKENTGLEMVKVIREEFGMLEVRIVLRTGQPGYAPELQAIRDYDINDYKTKSELTLTRLVTTLTTAIRSYDQLATISASRRGLRMIVDSATDLFGRRGLENFAAGVLTQISALVRLSPEGLIAAKAETAPHHSHVDDEPVIVGAAGKFRDWINHPLHDLQDKKIANALRQCLEQRRNIIDESGTTLFFSTSAERDIAVYLNTGEPLTAMDTQMLEVFCTNIAIGFENVDLFQQLNAYAFSDLLCNIPNRTRLLQIIAEQRQTGSAGWTIALVDVDHFSEINDALGHENGDRLLRAVAERLRGGLNKETILARIAADTFAIFGKNDHIDPLQLQHLFDTPFAVSEYFLRVRGTIGLATLDNGQNEQTALQHAHIALNRAKNDLRGRYCYYTAEMETETKSRLTLLHDLRAAIEAQGLELHFQPQIDLHTGKIVGAEALLRWNTPQGMIPPDRFIPLAEYSGLIIDLGEWVLRSACIEAKKWHQNGFPDLRIAINVSMVQFRSPSFVKMVKQALEDIAIDPHLVELEITESVAMEGAIGLENLLNQLRGLGVMLAIDDFGTGFSSLSYLQRLNVDRLKIDRSFVNTLGAADAQTSIAEMIVRLGQNLKLTVIAEGVETEDQAQALRQLGCQEAQGFLYSKALPASQFFNWLKAH